MNPSLFVLVITLGLFGVTLGGCTKTYSEPQLKKMERKQDMSEGAAEKRDDELATEGGNDAAEDEDNDEEIDREINQ